MPTFSLKPIIYLIIIVAYYFAVGFISFFLYALVIRYNLLGINNDFLLDNAFMREGMISAFLWVFFIFGLIIPTSILSVFLLIYRLFK